MYTSTMYLHMLSDACDSAQSHSAPHRALRPRPWTVNRERNPAIAPLRRMANSSSGITRIYHCERAQL